MGEKSHLQYLQRLVLLVAGDKMGPSKRTKAESLNIEIITEQEFLNKLE